MDVHDVAGRRVASFFSETLDGGSHTLRWDGMSEHGQRVGSGLYFIQVRVNGHPYRASKLIWTD